MVKLTANDPTSGVLPLTYGGALLRAIPQRRITSVAPFKGAEADISKTLLAAIGVSLPETGSISASENTEIIWSGLGQYFVLQPDGAPDLPPLKAAATDQSDGWVAVLLEGAQAEDVLARLCPLDLRKMAEGDAARSLIGHMNAVIIRRAQGFELMVFRSMTQTLVHEFDRVMRSVAAQVSQQS